MEKRQPQLPRLEAEPTNDTTALTCYALDWRERAINAETINEKLLATLEWINNQPMGAMYAEVRDAARNAIKEAKGE